MTNLETAGVSATILIFGTTPSKKGNWVTNDVKAKSKIIYL